ncbi:MAG: hypothetical protein EXS16_12945 [Gemmataceae bacterium]|nr:hypothetical protein [Gemmataceae bacterium]
MQQEDKGLVYRGLILLTLIGVLVLVVLAILFWRPQPIRTVESTTPPELRVPILVAPSIGGFPGAIAWLAMWDFAENAPSMPGWEIRYNAAATLARRGSDVVPWHLFAEMLDERQQLRNNRVRQPDGRHIHDEAVARATTLNALRAIAVWNEKRGDKKSNIPIAVREQVEKLAQSPAFELKVQAERTRATFK